VQLSLRSNKVPGSTNPIFAISLAMRLASARCSAVAATGQPSHLGIPHRGDSTQYIYGMPSEVVEAIASFRSRSVDETAAAFAREVVRQAEPRSESRARALLFATSRLADFGQLHGMCLTKEVLLHPSVIERFCQSGLGSVSGASKRTIRTNLRYVSARVLLAQATPAPLSRERAKAPYSESEIASYLALADAQPTLARRFHASALICLGAGAGLMGQDLRSVRGTDVICRSGGVLVDVGGRKPRPVPVVSKFQGRLLEASRFSGGNYLIGGAEASRRNVTTPLISALAGGEHLSRLDTGRLRATWLRFCAASLGLRAFMDAAGIVCSQRLGDIVAHLDEVSEDVAVTLLGAAR
jgi:hypothetical protein